MKVQEVKAVLTPKVKLPTYESTLDESAKKLLGEQISEGAQAAGVGELPPAGSIPSAQSYAKAETSTPVYAGADAATVAPILQIPAEVIGSLEVNSPLDKAMVAGLQAMQDEAKRKFGGNRPPIQSAPAKLSVNGRSQYIPESVRDVPNTLVTYEPGDALKRYFLFLSRLTDDESDELTDLAHRGNGKPLVWLSEKIYWLLAIIKWEPEKDSAVEAFHPDDAKPESYSYKLIMSTFGLDGGLVLIQAAERANIAVLDVVKQVCLKMIARNRAQVEQVARAQTVNTWKRSRPVESSQSPSLAASA